MKKLCTIFTLVLLVAGYSYAQNQTDQKEILRICLQNPELQNITGILESEVVVMQHGVSFDFVDTFIIPERDVLFLEKDVIIQNGIASYFLFWRFDVDEDSAMVEYYFHIDEDECIEVLFELLKINGEWEVSKSSNERRLL